MNDSTALFSKCKKQKQMFDPISLSQSDYHEFTSVWRCDGIWVNTTQSHSGDAMACLMPLNHTEAAESSIWKGLDEQNGMEQAKNSIVCVIELQHVRAADASAMEDSAKISHEFYDRHVSYEHVIGATITLTMGMEACRSQMAYVRLTIV